MSSPHLNVIALISGGKDSFFSILHCQANGHNVVALANLYPPLQPNHEQSEDIDSFMYQTVGHEIIPLYAEALGLPLFRQEILGGAVNDQREYAPPAEGEDETESLVPLLLRIKKEIPGVNAISTGAILSTYQRTRVESVALRLGLVPLSYLWQYVSLPPYLQTGLLRDMRAVGQDARIIKVASGGLDESFLWQDVADENVIQRMRKKMAMFGGGEGGALIGEGGEFETLAVDGPARMWKKRIEVEGVQKVTGEGGSALARLKGAKLVVKSLAMDAGTDVQIPSILDVEFEALFFSLEALSDKTSLADHSDAEFLPTKTIWPTGAAHERRTNRRQSFGPLQISNLYSQEGPVTAQITDISIQLRKHLQDLDLDPSDVITSTLLLRDMSAFTTINPIYGALFTTPNPPSRVTISCGNLLPESVHVTLSVLVDTNGSKQQRNGLHVQSRSYWAPANIGPYSQAIGVQLGDAEGPRAVYIAGQIPLVPASMELVSASQLPWKTEVTESTATSRDFLAQAVLSLQHLWRIGRAMDVIAWTGAVAFISSCPCAQALQRAAIASAVWCGIHETPLVAHDQAENKEDAEDYDVWHTRSRISIFSVSDVEIDTRSLLPDSSKITYTRTRAPPVFVVQVTSLPREADIEWCSTGIAAAANITYTSAAQRNYVEQHCITQIRKSQRTEFIYAAFQKASQVEALMVREEKDSGELVSRIMTVYARTALPESFRETYGLQLVPCYGIWRQEETGLKEYDILIVMRKDIRTAELETEEE